MCDDDDVGVGAKQGIDGGADPGGTGIPAFAARGGGGSGLFPILAAEVGPAAGNLGEDQAVPVAEMKLAQGGVMRQAGAAPGQRIGRGRSADQVGGDQRRVAGQMRIQPRDSGGIGQIGGNVAPAGKAFGMGRAVADSQNRVTAGGLSAPAAGLQSR